MQLIPYDRPAALAYAEQWAYTRNPRYFRFDGIGGDCTNFVSQCLYAGCGIMNDTRDIGWYYNSPIDRAAAWSGVPYLFRFLTKNKGRGPFGHEAPVESLQSGDILQLGHGEGTWYHTLLVTGHSEDGELLVTTHTYDAHLRPLSSYQYDRSRGIALDGARR